MNTIGLEGYIQEPNNHAGEMTTISNYGGSKVENVTVITNEVCASSYGQIGANPGVVIYYINIYLIFTSDVSMFGHP